MPHDSESTAPRETWWNRTAGGKEVLQVSLPLVVSSLSWTVMTFVDRVFLKWDSGEAMAAAFSASTIWFAVLCMPLGICMYCAAFVSQYHGNKQPLRIGPAVWQGVYVALILSPLLMLAIPLAPSIFDLAQHEPNVRELEIIYFQVLCWGIPAMLISQSLSAFYAGRGKTSVVMAVDTGIALLNVFLDYAWIFGEFGLPAWGIAGAGWATVTSLWVKTVIYAALLTQTKHRRAFNSLGIRFDRRLFGRLIYYGAPSGFQLVIDVMGFTCFIMLVGRLGVVEAEATSMAFSISTLAFMPIWGFAQAVSILVGQHLGENRDDLSARATWTTLRVALGYMAFISLLYLFVPGWFLAPFFYSAEGTVTDGDVWQLSVELLRFVAAYNLLDAMMMIFVHAVKGAGDTPFVLKVSLVMASSMIFASWLAVEVFEISIYGCWALLTGWVWTLGVIFMLRFLHGKWRKMRVIEPIVIEPEAPRKELCTVT